MLNLLPAFPSESKYFDRSHTLPQPFISCKNRRVKLLLPLAIVFCKQQLYPRNRRKGQD